MIPFLISLRFHHGIPRKRITLHAAAKQCEATFLFLANITMFAFALIMSSDLLWCNLRREIIYAFMTLCNYCMYLQITRNAGCL